MITTQIVERIINSPLVVADLSEHNPNVFYELAIRHAIQKPVIHIIHHEDRIPFDVQQFRTIYYNLQDPDSVEKCKTELVDQIRWVMANPSSSDNPVTGTVLLMQLRDSSIPLEIATSKFVRNLEALEKIVRAFDARIGFGGRRGELLQDTSHSLARLGDLVESAISDGIDLESADALRTALNLHDESLSRLLRSFGVE